MTVYVDDMNQSYTNRFRRKLIMSHMMADTVEELHVMADKIGVNRRWFQSPDREPHYDICKSKKEQAIQEGAISITHKQLACMNMRRRLTGELGKPDTAEEWAKQYFANKQKFKPADW
jgi:hypothetical protein